MRSERLGGWGHAPILRQKQNKPSGDYTMTATLTNHDHQQERQVVNGARTRAGVTYSPRIDILETADELVLYVDLPGVVHEDLDIQFENGELTLNGKVTPRQENVKFLYAEYGTGDFHRTFSIGEMIDADRIVAELNSGVLTLHLPKAEKVKPRRIEVKAS
jgi:HSP20 family molecular chaperone IbpA